MKVSIIISTFSLKRFPDLIEIMSACNQQCDHEFEMIFVIDENILLLKKLDLYIKERQHIFPWVKLIFNERNYGLSHSRNVGVKNSSGDICAFLDDDAIPANDWVDSISENFKSSQVGAVAGDVQPLWEDESMSWFPRELYWMISCSYTLTPTERKEATRGFGVNMAFRKSLIESLGYFDESLGIRPGMWIGGEDTDLFLRVQKSGANVVFDPSIKVLHKIPKDRIELRNLARRAYFGGLSIALIKSKCDYNLTNANEGQYIKQIVTKFYPATIRLLFSTDIQIALKRAFYMSIVSLFESIGFLFEFIFKINTKKLARKYSPEKGNIV